MDIVLGLVLGGVWAVLDAALMRVVIRRASRDRKRASTIVMTGFAARYLGTFAVLAAALLVPGINAVAVMIPLIAGKIVVVIFTALGKDK